MAKMTREEAIELLKNRKVYVNGKSAEIQLRLFELGFKWAFGIATVKFVSAPFLFLTDNCITGCGDDMVEFINSKFTEISAEEILSIEIAESLKENDVVSCVFKNTDANPWISVIKSGNSQRYGYKVAMITKGINSGNLYFDAYSDMQAFCRPATEEEKQKLIDALKTSEDSRAKEILKEVFGIEENPECPFKPFDKVMVRNENSQIWTITFFDKYKSGVEFPYYTLNGIFKQCIPYENNEHLKDTTNKPEE